MHRTFELLWRVALCASLAVSAAAQTPESTGAEAAETGAEARDTRAEHVEELYQITGLGLRLATLRKDVVTRLEAGNPAKPELERARRAVEQSFAPERIDRDVIAGLEKRYDAKLAPAALEWWRSPLGRRITAQAEEVGKPGAQQTLVAFGQKLAKEPATPARQKLVNRIEAAAHSTEITLDQSSSVSLAVALALNELAPAAQRVGAEAIQTTITRERRRLRGERRQLSVILILFAYRDLSDADLGKYADFAESDAGRWYFTSVREAANEALDAAARGVGAALSPKAAPPAG